MRNTQPLTQKLTAPLAFDLSADVPLALIEGVGSLLSLFANGEDGLLFENFSELDELFTTTQMLTAVASDGNTVGVAMSDSQWAGKSLSQVRAEAAELVNTATQSLVKASGSLSAGGWNFTSTGTFAGFKQATSSNPVGSVAASNIDWSGNDEGRSVNTDFGGGLGPAYGSGASGGPIDGLNICSVDISALNIFLNPTASGDTTAFMRLNSLKRLPGTHAWQATAGARPLWKANSGKPYLLFDGSNDNLLTGYVAQAGANCIIAKVQVPASLAATQIIAGAQGSGANRYFLGFDTSGRLIGGVGSDDETVIKGSNDLRGLSVTVGLSFDGTTVKLFEELAEVYSASQNSTPTTTIPLRIAARNNNGTADDFAAINLFGLVVARQMLTLDDFQRYRRLLVPFELGGEGLSQASPPGYTLLRTLNDDGSYKTMQTKNDSGTYVPGYGAN